MSKRSSRSRFSSRAAAIVLVLMVVALIAGTRVVAHIGGSSSPAETATDVPVTHTARPTAPAPVAGDSDLIGSTATNDPNDTGTVRQRHPLAPDSPGAGAAPTTTDLTAADGYIPDGTSLSPFDNDAPAIANLDPDLRDAVQEAATDASDDGITMVINSGWRSADYQQELLDEAVVTYGSLEEARKWVDTPDTSNHVTGEAVDVGDADADAWLQENGSNYGLCQTYANEIWHFQLMTDPGSTCPAPLADASGG